jgi:chloramphenicol-sensitive protein RarD
MNRGILLGVGAYVMWGFLPIYWKALDRVDSFEILAHRIVWSVLFLAVVITLRRSWDQVRNLTARQLGRLLLAGALLAINWATYIWAVNHGHIIESSLGYFINPLLNVVFGVLILRERLEPGQRIAVGLAAIGVGYMTVRVGSLPWIALVLATSFALYGLLKKQLMSVGPIESLTVEVALLLLPALAFLTVRGIDGSAGFISDGPRTTVLLVLSGLATALPLLFFGAAAHRIKLITIGLLQYIAPTLQFLIGVFLYGEVVGDRLPGFILVWLALVVYSGHSLVRRRRDAPQPVAA